MPSPHDHSWNGKVVFITGAGTGIGQATALAFAQRGAKLALAGSSEAPLHDTAQRIATLGGTETLCLPCNVTNEDDLARTLSLIEKEWGRLDAAFNNAGIGQGGTPTASISTEEWKRVVDIDLTGTFLSMKYEIPLMLKSGGGAIVNSASTAGLVGFRSAAAYTAAKFGVVGLTKAAAMDYAREAIRINAICPGPIETPMIEKFLGGAEGLRRTKEAQPIGRLGQREEIAEMVVSMCNPATAYLTGSAIAIDGGQTSGVMG